MGHTSWRKLRAERERDPAFEQAYQEAALAHELGTRIRELRLSRGLSQSALARLAGTSQSAIARLEMGGTNPRVNTLARLSKVLGAELVVLLRESAAA